MALYTYGGCLEQSNQVHWMVKDVLGTLDFDSNRPWLPAELSGGSGIFCLDAEEKRKLTQVEMGAYAHLFGFLESFVGPLMADLAQDFQGGDGEAFAALTNFASEEVKHIQLFQEVCRRVGIKLGFPLQLVTGQAEVARAVLTKNKGALLLLTSAIEWFTQHQYFSAMRLSDELDPLTREVFRCHWLEEAQHTQLDHLEVLRHFREMTPPERQAAVEDFIWLLVAVDGLLEQQAVLDVANLSEHLDRAFTDEEQQDILVSLLGAKRRAFLEGGVTHPNFLELFLSVTTSAQQARVQEAVTLLLQKSPFH